MRVDRKVVGKSVLIRNIEQNDCNLRYLSWLEDPKVNQYLETRWQKQSLSKIKPFVKVASKSRDSILFAIVELSSNKHIGNIKIGPINYNHMHANISYFIGDSSAWGKGYASEAVSLVTGYAVKVLKLETVIACVYEGNLGSQKVLEKTGYKLSGIFKEQFLNVKNEREDALYFYYKKYNILSLEFAH